MDSSAYGINAMINIDAGDTAFQNNNRIKCRHM